MVTLAPEINILQTNTSGIMLRDRKFSAMTLIEVLISLAVVSMIFLSINRLTFDSLKQVKKLEMEDNMRAYANEAIQSTTQIKDRGWGSFSSVFINATTPAARIKYPTATDPKTYLVGTPCDFDIVKGTLSSSNVNDCLATTPASANQMFGRIIKACGTPVTLTNPCPALTTASQSAMLTVTVACIETKCGSKDFQPLQVVFYVYKTGQL